MSLKEMAVAITCCLGYDDFKVGSCVIMTTPFIDPDDEFIVEGEPGVVLEKDKKNPSLYLVDLINAKRRLWLRKESIEHLKTKASSPVRF